MSQKLVAYFSASGVTAKAAAELAKAADAALYEIRPKVPYTKADLNWMNKKSRSSVEMADASSRPELADFDAPVAEADVIYVGFPIWWYRHPSIIDTFLETYDFSGKTVVPFATSGSSGMGNTAELMQKIVPAANVKEGKRLQARVKAQDLESWVKQYA
ncbi:MAG: NAD(P)H-dependent oxidoreductase [Clostridia bacterium]|nr:NAD(P)H-dependent oxidoreductase [Clostridia bacterium]